MRFSDFLLCGAVLLFCAALSAQEAVAQRYGGGPPPSAEDYWGDASYMAAVERQLGVKFGVMDAQTSSALQKNGTSTMGPAIAELDPSGVAASAGMRVGDVIDRVNGIYISGIGGFQKESEYFFCGSADDELNLQGRRVSSFRVFDYWWPVKVEMMQSARTCGQAASAAPARIAGVGYHDLTVSSMSAPDYRRQMNKFAAQLVGQCSRGCILTVTDNTGDVEKYAFSHYGHNGAFTRLTSDMGRDFFSSFEGQPFVMNLIRGGDDLALIEQTYRSEVGVALLYYQFAIQYGIQCESNIPMSERAQLLFVSESYSVAPWSGSKSVTGRTQFTRLVEADFAERAAQFGNWYVSGINSNATNRGLRDFIGENGCSSGQVQGLRASLKRFGEFHDARYKKITFR